MVRRGWKHAVKSNRKIKCELSNIRSPVLQKKKKKAVSERGFNMQSGKIALKCIRRLFTALEQLNTHY